MEQPTSPAAAQRPHNGLNGAKKQKDSQKARHRIGKAILYKFIASDNYYDSLKQAFGSALI
jgi:hypothetical protein